MSLVKLLFFLAVMMIISFTASAVAIEPEGLFSEALGVESYDCSLSLQTAKSLSRTASLRLDFEWSNHTSSGLQLRISHSALTLSHIDGKINTQLMRTIARFTPGESVELAILRRGEMLGVSVNDQLLYMERVPRGPGSAALVTADRGWTVQESTVQRLAPVYFTDDFMRTKDDPGSWTLLRGNWMLQSTWDAIPHGNTNKFAFVSYAQNPFAWMGSAPPDSPFALCMAGDPFWEDYRYSVSLHPGEGGAAGVAINMIDEKNGLIIRWSPVNDRSARGNRLLVYRLTNGKIAAETLASSIGGYIPGQWYRLTVVSAMQGIRVLIDGNERLTLAAMANWRGGIGLYAEGENAVVFDDVTVFGRQVNIDVLKEIRQNSRMENDPHGMASWSSWRSDWKPAGVGSAYWMRQTVYGEHLWTYLSVKPTEEATGEIRLVLNGDGSNVQSGFRALIQQQDDLAQVSYRIFRNDVEIAASTAARLNAGEEYTVRFWRSGASLRIEVDGEVVLEAHGVAPLAGLTPGYSATGALQNVEQVMVIGEGIQDYFFADAPVDWIARGAWLPTIRWACSPNWSFLSGWGRGDTALFHKSSIRGNQAIHAYVGVNMEYSRESEGYGKRFRDLAVSLCSDGVSPRSGYAGIFPYIAAPNAAPAIAILRNGVVVASQVLTDEQTPDRITSHQTWFELELSKQEGQLHFSASWLRKLDDQQRMQATISYTDPQPLTEGIPAVWTHNNCISVARVRLRHAEALQPATKPKVLLGHPWYPEWANLHEPLSVDFTARVWSTGSQNLSFTVKAMSVPPGNDGAMAIRDLNAVITPQVAARPGVEDPRAAREHWYAITAGDTTAYSSPFHISVQVYDPTIGRDDAKALALYRFNEGAGSIVKDQSKATPALDLVIANRGDTKERSADWLPGQGLTLARDSVVISAMPADKLLALNESKEGSVEFWVSSETFFPNVEATNWIACLLSWDDLNNAGGARRNITVAQYVEALAIIPHTGKLFHENDETIRRFPGAHLGLQHAVLTWNREEINVYIDGKKIYAQSNPGQFEHNVAGSRLILGNAAGMTNAFIGNLYLLAIHSVEMNPELVQRHYQAGPSAR